MLSDLALASNQKLGDPAQGGILVPAITGTAFGDYGVQVAGAVEGRLATGPCRTSGFVRAGATEAPNRGRTRRECAGEGRFIDRPS